jgi:hypothetical protein
MMRIDWISVRLGMGSGANETPAGAPAGANPWAGQAGGGS